MFENVFCEIFFVKNIIFKPENTAYSPIFPWRDLDIFLS